MSLNRNRPQNRRLRKSDPLLFVTDQLSRIEAVFSRTAQEQRMALMPFLMAGDPDLSTTAEVLLSLQANGADIVELGIPYSDPLADGPVIQAAAFRALEQKTTPAKVIEMLAGLKDQLSMPVILFTYTNPLLNRGPERFFEEAAAAEVRKKEIFRNRFKMRCEEIGFKDETIEMANCILKQEEIEVIRETKEPTVVNDSSKKSGYTFCQKMPGYNPYATSYHCW